MRLLIIEVLIGLLLVLLPLVGALFGYVVAAFLRLGPPWTFRLINATAVLLAPTPLFIVNGGDLAPAGFVLLNSVLERPSTAGVILAIGSMVGLTFVNMGISKYIKR